MRLKELIFEQHPELEEMSGTKEAFELLEQASKGRLGKHICFGSTVKSIMRRLYCTDLRSFN